MSRFYYPPGFSPLGEPSDFEGLALKEITQRKYLPNLIYYFKSHTRSNLSHIDVPFTFNGVTKTRRIRSAPAMNKQPFIVAYIKPVKLIG